MTSACTNPLLYGFLNESFKKEFKNESFINKSSKKKFKVIWMQIVRVGIRKESRMKVELHF